jgi:hypothetical protein
MTRSNWEVEDGAELSLVNNTRLRMLDATGKVANRVENFPLRFAQIFLRCVVPTGNSTADVITRIG